MKKNKVKIRYIGLYTYTMFAVHDTVLNRSIFKLSSCRWHISL